MNIFYTQLVSFIICFGCYSSLSAQCNFTTSSNPVCGEQSVNFVVTNPSGTYTWDFDEDGTIDASGNNVNFTFPASTIDQVYTVELFLNGNSCQQEDVIVQLTPDAAIEVVPGSGTQIDSLIRVCSGTEDVTLYLYNASTTYSSNATYFFDWGDGNTETLTNAEFPNTGFYTHAYSGYGYYYIELTVTSNDGCTGTQFYTFYNGSNPSVGLANPGNTVGLCAPATINFPITNTAQNPIGTVYNISINGELIASYTQSNVPTNFIHTFLESSCGETTSTGNYENAFDVQIQAINPCGSSIATIEPIEVSEPPEVEFEVDIPSLGCVGDEFTITNASTGGAEVISGNPSNCSTNLSPSWLIEPGVAGVDWILTSGNLFSADEIQVEFLTPGDYTITMIINSEACGEFPYSQSFSIIEVSDAGADVTLANASAPALSDECAPTQASFQNNSTGDSLTYVWSISPSSGWDFVSGGSLTDANLDIVFNDPGTYQISMHASNICSADTWDTTLVIAGPPMVEINPIPDYCETATLNFDLFNVDYNANGGNFTSFSWSFPGGTPATSDEAYPTGIQYTTPGEYIVSVTVENQCGSFTDTDTFNIEVNGVINLGPDLTLCVHDDPIQLTASPGGGTWSGNGVNANGMFHPRPQNVGTNVLIYTYQFGLCNMTDSMTVTVLPAPDVDAGPDLESCIDDDPIFIGNGSPAGGNWSINNGGVLVGNNFDPIASGEGTYTLTYAYTDVNGCENDDSKIITVHGLPNVEAGPNQTICENPNDIQLTGYNPIGGTWAGNGVSPDGIFNAQNTPGPGSYLLTYTYTDPNTSCSNLDSIIITVVSNQIADAGPNETVCINDAPYELTSGMPAGGTWSGPGIDGIAGLFDPADAGVGTHIITYSVGSGYCQTDDTKLIQVLGLPNIDVPPNRSICVNDAAINLVASPTGGIWSGIGVSGTQFDPAITGVGTFTLTYSYTNPTTNCSNEEQMEVTVTPLPQLQANDTSYCNTPGLVYLPIASPSGGDWSGVGVVGDQFDPQQVGGVGQYILNYSYTNTNGCTNSTQITVSVIAPENVHAGDDLEVCIDHGIINLNDLASPAGGSWDANGSNGLNAYLFDPQQAGTGAHIITYSIGGGNCTVTDDIIIDIHPLPQLTVGADIAICAGDAPVSLTGFSPFGGTWSGQGIVDAANGIFDPSGLNTGNYVLTYTYTNAFGCTNFDHQVVNIQPLPIVNAGPDTTFCNAPAEVQLMSGIPANGVWSGFGITDAQNGIFNPAQAGGVGTHQLYYSFTDSQTGCTQTDTINVIIVAPQDIEAGPDDILCIDQGNFQLSGYTNIDGRWSGPGIIDEVNGIFDPVVAGAGVHTLTFSFGTGSCYVEDTKEIEVIDLSYVKAGPDEEACFTHLAFNLSGNQPGGGTWSGNGIIDPVNGTFDPAIAGVGSHTISYTFEDINSGCSIVRAKEVTVLPMEEAEFVMPELACRNDVIQFDNLSPASYTAEWTFGDGASSTEFEPNHTYHSAGIYDITLIITNQYGCKDTVDRQIVITDVPVAYFEPDTTLACEGITLNLNNQSYGEEMTYIWDFGNGQTSLEEHPEIIFFGAGINDTSYIITLNVANLCGSAVYQDVITVRPLPKPEIGFLVEGDCSPVSVSFANTTTGAATDFIWDFGNGNTSTDPVPGNQIYTTDSLASTYTVSLIASNSCGSDTAYQDIVVDPSDVRSFFSTSGTAGCEPFTVEFYNFATPGAIIDWDFGDGNTSAETNPVHTFENAGTYTVIQYASSQCGYDTSTIVIHVLPQPVVEFVHELKVCVGQEIEFFNMSQNVSGNIWDFGDGDSSNLTNPVHIYDTAGTYVVTLTGLSMFSQCPKTYSSIVRVMPLPVASFEPSDDVGCVPFTVEFFNNSQDASFFKWDFGDGNTTIGAVPIHTFTEVGSFNVTLIASDENGCYNDTTLLNILVNPVPTAEFEFDRADMCSLPAEIQFINNSEGAAGYEWTFGDGTTSTQNNPIHIYNQPDSFEITLIATNQFNCKDSSENLVTVFPRPEADFGIDGAEGCSPVEVQFVNRSSNSNNYYWDFGDGKPSREYAPIHRFDSAGYHSVKLVVSIHDVCFDSVELTNIVRVYPTPTANFEMLEVIKDDRNSGTFNFLNRSTNADYYFWDFSDGHTSEEESPQHRFTQNGARQIYLEASSVFGCVDDTLITLEPPCITGLFIPNGFSPEQGIGDVRLFKPKGIGLAEYHIQVFSPYGQLIWESRALENGQPAEAWDGTLNGQLLPQDVYVWKAFGLFKDGTVWQGERSENGGTKTMGSVILLR